VQSLQAEYSGKCSKKLATWHGLKEGDEVELQIKQIGRNGQGIARLHGCIVFVPGAAVGDKVKVRIMKLAARHAQAEIVKQLDESRDQGQAEK
jgi:predicted RNA-binding protein with TRAM domain